MIATVVNALAIFLGGLIGLILKSKLKKYVIVYLKL